MATYSVQRRRRRERKGECLVSRSGCCARCVSQGCIAAIFPPCLQLATYMLRRSCRYCCNIPCTISAVDSLPRTIERNNVHCSISHIALGGSHRQPRDSLHQHDRHGPHVHGRVEDHHPVDREAHRLRGCVGYCRRRHFVGARFC